MNRFFAPLLTSEDQEYQLDGQEAIHCITVLRKDLGDQIELINGKGLLAKGEIVEIYKKKGCKIQIESSLQKDNFPETHLAIAPTKNSDKIEWLIEKASELGISKVSFLICNNNERQKINNKRLNKIIVSAAKQSGRLHFLQIEDPIPIFTFIKKYPNGVIAHCRNSSKIPLTSLSKSCPFLIGPEGDFTKEEIEFAEQNGYKSISMGVQRLRTETAGLSASVILSQISGVLK